MAVPPGWVKATSVEAGGSAKTAAAAAIAIAEAVGVSARGVAAASIGEAVAIVAGSVVVVSVVAGVGGKEDVVEVGEKSSSIANRPGGTSLLFSTFWSLSTSGLGEKVGVASVGTGEEKAAEEVERGEGRKGGGGEEEAVEGEKGEGGVENALAAVVREEGVAGKVTVGEAGGGGGGGEEGVGEAGGECTARGGCWNCRRACACRRCCC